MPTAKVQLLVRIPPRLHMQVKLAAVRRRISVAQLVAEALAQYLRAPQKEERRHE